MFPGTLPGSTKARSVRLPQFVAHMGLLGQAVAAAALVGTAAAGGFDPSSLLARFPTAVASTMAHLKYEAGTAGLWPVPVCPEWSGLWSVLPWLQHAFLSRGSVLFAPRQLRRHQRVQSTLAFVA